MTGQHGGPGLKQDPAALIQRLLKPALLDDPVEAFDDHAKPRISFEDKDCILCTLALSLLKVVFFRYGDVKAKLEAGGLQFWG